MNAGRLNLTPPHLPQKQLTAGVPCTARHRTGLPGVGKKSTAKSRWSHVREQALRTKMKPAPVSPAQVTGHAQRKQWDSITTAGRVRDASKIPKLSFKAGDCPDRWLQPCD